MVEGHLTQNMTSVNTYITDLAEYHHDFADIGRRINNFMRDVVTLGGRERSIIDSEIRRCIFHTNASTRDGRSYRPLQTDCSIPYRQA